MACYEYCAINATRCALPISHVRLGKVADLYPFISLSCSQLILLRAIDYFAENMTSFRSTEICHKMRGSDLGDVIAHGRHPMLEFPPPTSSFDEEG